MESTGYLDPSDVPFSAALRGFATPRVRSTRSSPLPKNSIAESITTSGAFSYEGKFFRSACEASSRYPGIQPMLNVQNLNSVSPDSNRGALHGRQATPQRRCIKVIAPNTGGLPEVSWAEPDLLQRLALECFLRPLFTRRARNGQALIYKP